MNREDVVGLMIKLGFLPQMRILRYDELVERMVKFADMASEKERERIALEFDRRVVPGKS